MLSTKQGKKTVSLRSYHRIHHQSPVAVNLLFKAASLRLFLQNPIDYVAAIDDLYGAIAGCHELLVGGNS